jgi:hypothetical protein
MADKPRDAPKPEIRTLGGDAFKIGVRGMGAIQKAVDSYRSKKTRKPTSGRGNGRS